MIVPATEYEPIREFLYRDPFVNANLISIIERRLPELPEVWVLPGDPGTIMGVLVFTATVERRQHVCLEAANRASLKSLLTWLPPGDECAFALHRDWQLPVLEKQFAVWHEGTMEAYRCTRASFRADEPFPARPLTRDDARAVRRARRAPGYVVQRRATSKPRKSQPPLHRRSEGRRCSLFLHTLYAWRQRFSVYLVKYDTARLTVLGTPFTHDAGQSEKISEDFCLYCGQFG